MCLSTKLSFLCLSFALFSCAGTPPLRSYNLARTALKHAKKYEAKKRAPKSYQKASFLYKEGQIHFRGRYYGSAKEAFEESKEFAEKAEDLSRWKLHEEGNFSL